MKGNAVQQAYVFIIFTIISCIILTSCETSFDMGGRKEDQFDKQVTENIVDKGPVNHGTLRIFSTVPDTLNPLLTNNIYVQSFTTLIFESLVKLDATQKPVPHLADRWEVSEDGLEWIFYLRENIFWHNGDIFTAHDVKFTFDIITSSFSNSIYAKNVINIKECELLNEFTIKFKLIKPDSFTAELMTFPIICEKHYGGLGEIKSAGTITPIGTGPYKFVSYEKDKLIVLEANNKWWNSKATENSVHTPYISTINIKLFESNDEIDNAFESKEIDFLKVEKGQGYKYIGRKDINIKKFPGKNFEFITFNLSNPVLSDVNIRKAIELAVNRFELMNSVLPGEIILSDIPIMPGTWLNDGLSIEYSYPEKSVELLENDGWKLIDGKRYKYINGINQSLDFELLVNEDNSDRIIVARKIKEQLAEVGINIEIKEMNYNDVMENIHNKRFDMALTGIRINSRPDLSYLYSSSQMFTRSGTVYNLSGYKNTLVDNYLNKILTEHDPAMKKAYFINMKEIISKDSPYLGLYFYYDTLVYHKNIKGVSQPHVWDPLLGIPEWYIPDAIR